MEPVSLPVGVDMWTSDIQPARQATQPFTGPGTGSHWQPLTRGRGGRTGHPYLRIPAAVCIWLPWICTAVSTRLNELQQLGDCRRLGHPTHPFPCVSEFHTCMLCKGNFLPLGVEWERSCFLIVILETTEYVGIENTG